MAGPRCSRHLGQRDAGPGCLGPTLTAATGEVSYYLEFLKVCKEILKACRFPSPPFDV